MALTTTTYNIMADYFLEVTRHASNIIPTIDNSLQERFDREGGNSITMNRLSDVTVSNYTLTTSFTYAAGTTTSAVLTVNQRKYATQMIDDLDLNNMPTGLAMGYMKELMDNMSYNIIQAVEKDLLNQYSSVNAQNKLRTGTPIQLTKTNIYDYLRSMRSMLDYWGVSKSDRHMPLPSDVTALIDEKYITLDVAGQEARKEGHGASFQYAGFSIVENENVDVDISKGTATIAVLKGSAFRTAVSTYLTETTLTYDGGTALVVSVGNYIAILSSAASTLYEVVRCDTATTGASSGTVTISRAKLGTTAISHSDNSTIHAVTWNYNLFGYHRTGLYFVNTINNLRALPSTTRQATNVDMVYKWGRAIFYPKRGVTLKGYV